MIGTNPYTLNKMQRKYLSAGFELLIDVVRQDMEVLINGGSYLETQLCGFNLLPPGYRHKYDLSFLKQFLNVVFAIAYKFNDKDCYWLLNSVAEELAMNAVIEEAKMSAEIHEEEVDLDELYDLIFEDLDFEFLMDPSFDGIEDDQEFTSYNRIYNLSFKDWFKPFSFELFFRPKDGLVFGGVKS